MNEKKHVIPFVNCGLEVPVIKVSIDGKELLAVVDTGCEDGLFSDTLSDKVQEWYDTNVNLVAFSGDYAVKKIAKFSLSIEDKSGKSTEFAAFGYVADMTAISANLSGRIGKDTEISVILGGLFLDEHNCIIDYEKKELIIQ